LVEGDLWLREANIHVITKGALYGDATEQEAEVTAGDILVFEDFNLGDLYFKNATAGENTTIQVVGVVMSRGRLMDLELTVEGK
jgi:hypothetical protein